jgi:hypothetical protein
MIYGRWSSSCAELWAQVRPAAFTHSLQKPALREIGAQWLILRVYLGDDTHQHSHR